MAKGGLTMEVIGVGATFQYSGEATWTYVDWILCAVCVVSFILFMLCDDWDF